MIAATVLLFPACATTGTDMNVSLMGSGPEDGVVTHVMSREEFEKLFGGPPLTSFPSVDEVVPEEPVTISDSFTDTVSETAEGVRILPNMEPEDAAVQEIPDALDQEAGQGMVINVIPEKEAAEIRLTADENYSVSPAGETAEGPAAGDTDSFIRLAGEPEGPSVPISREESAVTDEIPFSVITVHEPAKVITERYEPPLAEILPTTEFMPEPKDSLISSFLERNTLLTAVGTVVFAFLILALLAGRSGRTAEGRGARTERPQPPYMEGSENETSDGVIEVMPGQPTWEKEPPVMDIRPGEERYSSLVMMRKQKAEAGADEISTVAV